MIETARTLNPTIPIIVRAANEEEAELLAGSGLQRVVYPRGAVADTMAQAALERVKATT
jgi:Trk K+ transport system NAD-binding subunit